jgi:tripartite-type tricarboxylate transporter receptor subunit TctC
MVNPKRLAEFPNVPTMKEAGFPDVGTVAWNGLFAPAATPKPILEALHKIVLKALQSPEVQDKFKKQKMNIAPSKSVAAAQAWLGGEMKHWKTITTSVKIETH